MSYMTVVFPADKLVRQPLMSTSAQIWNRAIANLADQSRYNAPAISFIKVPILSVAGGPGYCKIVPSDVALSDNADRPSNGRKLKL